MHGNFVKHFLFFCSIRSHPRFEQSIGCTPVGMMPKAGKEKAASRVSLEQTDKFVELIGKIKVSERECKLIY